MCARRVVGLIFGLIFVVVGLAVLFFFARVAELECSRPEPSTVQCVREIKWLGVVSMSRETIHNVRGAEVDKSCDEDGCTYRIVLHTGQGNVPLTAYYSSGQRAKTETAAKITAYVAQSTDEALEVREGNVILGSVTGVIFVVAGMAVAIRGALGRVR